MGKTKFERPYSNSLWQADFKLTWNDEWMISYLDDHSRFIPVSRIHHNPTAEHAIKLLEASMKRYGKPKQILTDRGTQFYPARGEGPSAFRILQWKQHPTHRCKRKKTLNNRQDRSLPQSIQIRSFNVPKPPTIRELLELPATTPRTKLSIPSRRILQRSRKGHIIVDRTQVPFNRKS
jgi:hypothetical protein